SSDSLPCIYIVPFPPPCVSSVAFPPHSKKASRPSTASAGDTRALTTGGGGMDVAMALATVFFCLLLLASAAISLLLLRLCLAALRRAPAPAARAPYAAVDPEAAARAAAPPAVPQQEPPLPAAWAKPKAPEPRRLAWREVEALTGGFDEAAVVGRGGSGGAVYLSRIPVLAGGPPAAVKVHRWCGGGERRLGAFRRELDLLRRVGRHPRLVALLAYSDDHERREARWCWSTCRAARWRTVSTTPPRRRSPGATACGCSTTWPPRWSTSTTPSPSCTATCQPPTCSSTAAAARGSATWGRPARAL
uniref:Protein kinase domain-containing protein n=1 Tax=Aegilops tauschii subsp. strangulata TaxID=200361 RepID=A0A453MS13_AEGTS